MAVPDLLGHDLRLLRLFPEDVDLLRQSGHRLLHRIHPPLDLFGGEYAGALQGVQHQALPFGQLTHGFRMIRLSLV